MIVMKEHICTTLEQANELAKFLNSKSADMYWQDIGGAVIPTFEIIGTPPYPKDSITPCWSLNALMELLPETVTVIDKENEEDYTYTDYILCIIKENEQWTIYYEEEAHSALAAEWLIDDTSENLIDAAYNVIVGLHNKGLL